MHEERKALEELEGGIRLGLYGEEGQMTACHEADELRWKIARADAVDRATRAALDETFGQAGGWNAVVAGVWLEPNLCEQVAYLVRWQWREQHAR